MQHDSKKIIWFQPVLKLQNFAWGDAFAAMKNAFGMRKYFSGNYVFPSPKLSEHH